MQGLSEADMRAKISAQLKEREEVYLRAPVILDGLNPTVAF